MTIKNNKVLVNRLHNTQTEEIFESVNGRKWMRRQIIDFSYTPPRYWKFSSYWDDIKNWTR